MTRRRHRSRLERVPGSPVVVRIAVPADLPVLDRELPSGRNDVHATEQDRILVHELP